MTQSLLDEPWDPGLQNERTRLAWLRTTLSGLSCSLLVARLLAEVSLGLAIAIGLAAIASSSVLGVHSSKRYANNHAALHSNRLTAGARSQLVVCGLVTIAAAGACCYIAIQ